MIFPQFFIPLFRYDAQVGEVLR